MLVQDDKERHTRLLARLTGQDTDLLLLLDNAEDCLVGPDATAFAQLLKQVRSVWWGTGLGARLFFKERRTLHWAGVRCSSAVLPSMSCSRVCVRLASTERRVTHALPWAGA